MQRPTLAALGLLICVAICVALPAFAVDPAELSDPALQARYIVLTHELRCVQCQNETLADSEVDVAADLRRQIRNMLLEGKSDRQILDFLVSRYSEFILFKPRYSPRNAWLWLSPVVLLLIGVFVGFRIVRARAALLPSDLEPIDGESVEEGAPPR
ncbi:MAG TPA: cytochrome c-type biogenesis protein [Steroidobacteraceae bacterium]|jgi:cytochrome c-type biogenesis protein CcmH|nr:cytochrome c-type biogenesis protein [Steroidobacteraceae bacterium]